MTSQIRSHVATYNILLLILYSKLARNVVVLMVLIRFNDA